MRIPSDLPADPSPRRRHRARWWIAGLVVGSIIILLVSLRSLANIYTDSLWFSSVNFHNVFSTLLVIKLGLFGVFGAIFFAVLWVNLVVRDRIAGRDIVLAQRTSWYGATSSTCTASTRGRIYDRRSGLRAGQG